MSEYQGPAFDPADPTNLLQHMDPQFRLGHAAASEEAAADNARLRAALAEISRRIPGPGYEGVGEVARDALRKPAIPRLR